MTKIPALVEFIFHYLTTFTQSYQQPQKVVNSKLLFCRWENWDFKKKLSNLPKVTEELINQNSSPVLCISKVWVFTCFATLFLMNNRKILMRTSISTAMSMEYAFLFAVNRLQLTKETATWYLVSISRQALIHLKFINQVSNLRTVSKDIK